MKKYLLFFTFFLLIFGSAFGSPSDTLYVDNDDEGYSESADPWTATVSTGAYNGDCRAITGIPGLGTWGQWAQWNPTIETASYYAVYFYLPRIGSGRDRAKYTINSSVEEPVSKYLDQNYYQCAEDPDYYKYSWNMLGIHYFVPGSDSYVKVENDSTSVVGFAFYADAVRLIKCPDEKKIDPVWRRLYDFGPTNMGEAKIWKLKIYNIGGTDLTVQSIASLTGIYTISEPNIPFVIPPRDYVEVSVNFIPNFEKTFNDTLIITSDDPIEPEIGIPLTGLGTTTTVIVNNDDGPPGYMEHLGTWSTSDSKAIFQGIPNSSSRYCTDPNARAEFVPNIPKSGEYNIYMALPGTANANSSALYEVWPFGSVTDSVHLNQNNSGYTEAIWRYIGTYYLFEGTFNSVFVVNDGSGGGYLRTDLMRFSTVSSVADIELSEDYHYFTDITKETTANWNFKIYNLGKVPLIISDMSTRSEYFKVADPTTFPLNIAGLDSAIVTVSFSPMSITSYRDTLTILSDDIDEQEQRIILAGNGIGIQVITDDTDSAKVEISEGNWSVSASINTINGSSLYCYLLHNHGAYITYYPDVPETREYDVYVSSAPLSSNSTSRAPYIIQPFGSLPDTVYINQNGLTTGNIWRYAGRYMFAEGNTNWIQVYNDTTLSNFNVDSMRTAIEDSIVIRADAIKLSEPGDTTAAVLVYPETGIPVKYSLSQNYPNPFNAITRIRYSTALEGRVTLKVFNIMGQEVRTLVDRVLPYGNHTIIWDGKNDFGQTVATGVYLVKMNAHNFSTVKKLLLMK